MKKVALILLTTLLCSAGYAQSNATNTAQQKVELALNNAIIIYFADNNNATGPTVTLPFNSVNDFQNGIESGSIDLVVKSNKKFDVSVGTNSNQFTYSGAATQNTNMSIPSVLNIKVLSNNTGGTIGNQFSSSNYFHLNQNARPLLENCDNGNNQTFSVKYKATPGFNYPAGVYSTQVIYTATQQ